MTAKLKVTGMACAAVLSLLTGCKPPVRDTVQRVVPVKVYVAMPDTISSYVTLTGGIEARNDAFVYSKTSEKLVSLQVKQGDGVTAGQVLATQYNESALQGRTVAAAALKSAEIQVQTGSDDFRRMEKLLEKKAVTKQQYDQAKSRFDIAQASHEQAKAALEQANVLYENAILRAPFNGRVAMIYFDVNEMVPAGQQVIKIVDAHTVKAKLNVPSVDMGKFGEGCAVVATFPSLPDTQFTGIVYRMDEAVDPATRTLTAEVRIDNGGGVLTSGLFGEFRIETAKRRGVVVVSEMTVMSTTQISTDEKGVQHEIPGYYVFIARGGKAVKKEVVPGIVSGGMTELSRGVAFGDSIVVVGQNVLKEGNAVRIVNGTER
jgi:membrane fusion protein, multidrug efflux system